MLYELLHKLHTKKDTVQNDIQACLLSKSDLHLREIFHYTLEKVTNVVLVTMAYQKSSKLYVLMHTQ